MKNIQKGFIIPAMIAIVLILTIGGGTYVYLESKKVPKVEMENKDTEVVASSTDNISTTEILKEKIEATSSSEIKVESKIVDQSTSSTSITKTQNISTVSDTNLKSTSTTSQKCSDAKCFISAINNCSQTSYQSKNENEVIGSYIEAEMLFNIKKSNNKCLVNVKLLSYKISATKDLLEAIGEEKVIGGGPDEIYPKLNKYAQDSIVGKIGVCDITNIKENFGELFKNKNVGGGLIGYKYLNEIMILLGTLAPDFNKTCYGQLFENILKFSN